MNKWQISNYKIKQALEIFIGKNLLIGKESILSRSIQDVILYLKSLHYIEMDELEIMEKYWLYSLMKIMSIKYIRYVMKYSDIKIKEDNPLVIYRNEINITRDSYSEVQFYRKNGLYNIWIVVVANEHKLLEPFEIKVDKGLKGIILINTNYQANQLTKEVEIMSIYDMNELPSSYW